MPYFLMKGLFTRPCNYSVHFETEKFSVNRDKLGLTFWINGPYKSGSWEYTIENGLDRFVGHIFRGA